MLHEHDANIRIAGYTDQPLQAIPCIEMQTIVAMIKCKPVYVFVDCLSCRLFTSNLRVEAAEADSKCLECRNRIPVIHGE